MPDIVVSGGPLDSATLARSFTPLALIERERHVLGQIATGMPLAQVLENLLCAVEAQSSDGMRTSILMLDEDGQHLRHGAAPSLPAAYNEAIDGIAIGEGVGSCGTVACRGTPVYTNEIATDPLWTGFRDLALSHGLRACWSTPVTGIDGTMLGTFAIYYDEPRFPTQADIEVITVITQTTALVIERHRTELQLRRSRDELRALDADREQAEAALRESEARLHASEAYWRSLFERLNEGVMVVEVVRDAAGLARTWRFAEINAAWERISGLSQAAARGRNVDDVIPGVEQEWIDTYIRVAETGEPVAFRMPLRALGHVYDIRASRIGPDRVGVLFQEISAQQRDEVRRAALLELNDRLRDLDDPAELSFAATEVMGRAMDVDRAGYATVSGGGETLVIERDWISPGFPSAAGIHRLDSYGDAISGLRRGETIVIDDIARDSRTSADTASFEAVATQALINLPLIEDGQLVALFFVNSRNPRAWTPDEISFVRDVAERTRAAIERRRAEHGLRDLAASLEQQIQLRTRELDRAWRLSQELLVIALPDGTITAINPTWTRLLGWEPHQLVGTKFIEYAHPDDLDATLTAFAGILEKSLVIPYEYRFRHKDGSYHWFAWTGAFEDGNVHASGRDLAIERQQAEALRQSQKMEAVGQLTGGLAHDFNNLLIGITGSLELLSTRVAQGRIKDVDRYVNAAQGAAKRAAALTHRLLAFSRRQTLAPKPTDVNRLVAGMEELVRRTVGPEIAVESAAAGGLWNTLVDPSQLENALLNLCINARDAMPGGGMLVIETGNRWLDERAARERELPPGQYVSLCISDNGTGMPPEVAARAFDPFFTTKPIGQGTGLGLSMIYGFARQSGGQARIYSEPGQGTMVCLYLPRHHGTTEETEVLAELAEAPRAGRDETVLIVDDEPTVRMLVAEVLEDLGYTAIEAADGAAGLRVLQSNVRIDLLVTDVGLPGGLNGRQVADAARAVRPELKVLFITGYAENAVLSHGHLDAGMYVLTKPFAMEVLASRIKELISGRGQTERGR